MLTLENIIAYTREFGGKHIAPYTKQTDEEGRFPKESFEALKKEGFTALLVPKEYGGLGGGADEHTKVCYELGRFCATSALCYMMHNTAVYAISTFGSEALKEEILSRVAKGEILLALGCERIVFAGRALRRLFPAIGEQSGIFLPGEDRVERTLDDDHLGLFEFGDDLRSIRIPAGEDGEDAVLQDSLAHLRLDVVFSHGSERLTVGLQGHDQPEDDVDPERESREEDQQQQGQADIEDLQAEVVGQASADAGDDAFGAGSVQVAVLF